MYYWYSKSFLNANEIRLKKDKQLISSRAFKQSQSNIFKAKAKKYSSIKRLESYNLSNCNDIMHTSSLILKECLFLLECVFSCNQTERNFWTSYHKKKFKPNLLYSPLEDEDRKSDFHKESKFTLLHT